MQSEINGLATDPWHLQRFVDAQSTCFSQVRTELLAGQKLTHWMWFIFPQLSGLGSSSSAQRFAISGLQEANAYLLHATLGERLRDCTALVNKVNDRAIEDIFSHPDHLKFHSSMTLFACAIADGPAMQMLGNHVFREALQKYFNGFQDQATLSRLHT